MDLLASRWGVPAWPAAEVDHRKEVRMSRFRMGLAVVAMTMTALAVPGSFIAGGGVANAAVRFLEGPLQPCVRVRRTEQRSR